ncbi:MAG TPA: DUF2953 domain-containing protein [Firmicutes bacterium]|nr:DUF2953 domain-containing protein [Bacillota bacterium]
MKLLFMLFPFYTCIMLLIQLVPVRINLFFVRENKDDFLALRVNTFFSLLRFTVEVPLVRQETPYSLTMEAELKAGEDKLVRERKKSFSLFDIDWRKVRAHLRWLSRNRKILAGVTRFYLRAVTVEKFVCRLSCGTGDAALTGLAVGSCWACAGSMLALLQHWLRFAARPQFTVQPLYSRTGVDLHLDTVVSFRIGHFTMGGLMFLFMKIRGGTK